MLSEFEIKHRYQGSQRQYWSVFYLNQHDIEGVHNLILQDICDCIAGKKLLIIDINGLDRCILRASRKVRVLRIIYFAPAYCVKKKKKLGTFNSYTPPPKKIAFYTFFFFHFNMFFHGMLVQLLNKLHVKYSFKELIFYLAWIAQHSGWFCWLENS